MGSKTFLSIIGSIYIIAILLYIFDAVISYNRDKLKNFIKFIKLDFHLVRIGLDLIMIFVVLALGRSYAIYIGPPVEKQVANINEFVDAIPTTLPTYVRDIYHSAIEFYQGIDGGDFYEVGSPPPYTPFMVFETNTPITPTKAYRKVQTANPQPLTTTQILMSSKTLTSFPTETITSLPTRRTTPTIAMNLSKVAVSRTTKQELKNLESIWTVDPNIDPIIQSGLFYKSFKGEISQSDHYRWPIKWCAKGRNLLPKNLEIMAVEFFIDGQEVPSNYVYEYENAGNNWYCHYWVSTLSDWTSYTKVDLMTRIIIKENLFDGEDTFSKGTYQIKLQISVNP
ncbi:MAG: hypothetical protein JW908_09215 [Anaerolineales bacterium]|nr:hypothetical protein [Anaerolineales bacterium]